jgi:hypothetical protein
MVPSFSETPISEAKPANESSTGPAAQWIKHSAAINMPFQSPRRTAGTSFFIAKFG